jgi:hypothetical protein
MCRDLFRDFERDSLEVYNSPQTNLGAARATLNHLEDSPTLRCLQANVSVTATQIEERGPGYSRLAALCAPDHIEKASSHRESFVTTSKLII